MVDILWRFFSKSRVWDKVHLIFGDTRIVFHRNVAKAEGSLCVVPKTSWSLLAISVQLQFVKG